MDRESLLTHFTLVRRRVEQRDLQIGNHKLIILDLAGNDAALNQAHALLTHLENEQERDLAAMDALLDELDKLERGQTEEGNCSSI